MPTLPPRRQRIVTLYAFSATEGWVRCSLPEATEGDTPQEKERKYPQLLINAVDAFQTPSPGVGAGVPVPLTPVDATDTSAPAGCKVLQPDQLATFFAGNGWARAGAFMLGAHAPLLLGFCVGEARWLEVARQPAVVELIRNRQAPVISAGQLGQEAITAAELAAARTALAWAIQTVVGCRGVPASTQGSSATVCAVVRLRPRIKTDPPTLLPAGARPPAARTELDQLAGYSRPIWDWLEQWQPGAPNAVQPPGEVGSRYQSVCDALRQGAPAPTTRQGGTIGAVQDVLAFAARSLDLAAQQVGFAARWFTLEVIDPWSPGIRSTKLHVPLLAASPAEQRAAPYEVTSLFAPDSGSHHQVSSREFALNAALRNRIIDQAPTDLAIRSGDSATDQTAKLNSQRVWMEQQLIPTLRLQAEWAAALRRPAPAPVPGAEIAITGTSGGQSANFYYPRPGGAPPSQPAAVATTLLASFPAEGLVAFTPFDEVWLIPDAVAAAQYLEVATRRRDAILNAALTWDVVGGYGNGSRWVPMLTEGQLRSSSPDHLTLDRARVSSYVDSVSATRRAELLSWKGETPTPPTTQPLIPRGALPYMQDRIVRQRAFALRRPAAQPAGSAGQVAGLAGTSQELDWIYAPSPVGFAFLHGKAEKRLLPPGMRLYKFNAGPSLFFPTRRDTNEATDPYAQAVSPWWSPVDGYEHGSAWAQRMDVSRMAALWAVLEAARRRERDPRLVGASLLQQYVELPVGPMLESGRLTSVVKENWNPLRYICAIRLVQPVFAFFGGFASMERIDLEPEFNPPNNPAVGDVLRAGAKLSQLGSVNAAGGVTPQWPEPSLRDASRRPNPSTGARAAPPTTGELPGGSTQFYIPNLTYRHFRFVHLQAEWRSLNAQPVPDTAFARGTDGDPNANGVKATFNTGEEPDYSLLDLYAVK